MLPGELKCKPSLLSGCVQAYVRYMDGSHWDPTCCHVVPLYLITLIHLLTLSSWEGRLTHGHSSLSHPFHSFLW